jgi:hypothetical protein
VRTIFDFINDILFQKKGDKLDDIESESQYNSYMINRWISMYSPQMAQLINLTSNKLYSAFPTKRHNYRFLVHFLPKTGFKRTNYIKKISKDKKDTDNSINILARNLELSEREIRYYIDQGSITLPKL